MRNNVENELTFNVNKAVKRIVNDFLFVQQTDEFGEFKGA